MTIQMGSGPAQPASLKRIRGTASWAIDFGGAVLFPERAPKLRLRVQDAMEWETEILQRFPSVQFPAQNADHPACCMERRETA
jgi:hypothetical protein